MSDTIKKSTQSISVILDINSNPRIFQSDIEIETAVLAIEIARQLLDGKNIYSEAKITFEVIEVPEDYHKKV